MAHPKDRQGLTRRQLLRGAAVAAVGAGTAGVLAGCQNTTTAIGACEDGGSSGGGAGGLASQLVVAKPTGPDGLPLPRTDNSVTWAITDDNPPIADGLKPEGGTLESTTTPTTSGPALVKRFEKQYDCKVEIATYNSSDEAIAKLVGGGGRLRRRDRPERRARWSQLHRAAADAAAQPHLPAEPRQEHLAAAAGPVLRPRRALHGALRRLAGRHRLAQRQDRRGHRRR